MKQRTDAPSTELTLNRDNPAVNKALIELVGLLARRPARKWYHQQVEAHRRDREASQTLNADAGRRTGGDAPKKPPMPVRQRHVAKSCVRRRRSDLNVNNPARGLEQTRLVDISRQCSFGRNAPLADIGGLPGSGRWRAGPRSRAATSRIGPSELALANARAIQPTAFDLQKVT